jgi:hypothetical protein
MFWSYRGLNKVHRDLWHDEKHRRSTERSRFYELYLNLKNGSADQRQAAKDIWNILVSKY